MDQLAVIQEKTTKKYVQNKDLWGVYLNAKPAEKHAPLMAISSCFHKTLALLCGGVVIIKNIGDYYGMPRN